MSEVTGEMSLPYFDYLTTTLYGFHKLGVLVADVMGVPFFTNTTGTREPVSLVRNYYNPHAIPSHKFLGAITAAGLPIGYVLRNVADVLCPMIDSRLIYVQAVIFNPEGTVKTGDKMEAHIDVYTKLDSFPTTLNALKAKGMKFLVEYTQSEALSRTCSRYNEEERMDVDEAFKIEFQRTKMKLNAVYPLKPPQSIITTELLPHQMDALGWLLHRENPCELPPFWDIQDGKCVHELMNWVIPDCLPQPILGGLFADEMGLGKTLCLLSLISIDKLTMSAYRRIPDGDLIPLVQSGSNTTLIICPPSVLSNWTSQIEEHTRSESLSVYLYYGERTKDIEVLKRQDIVLTTYATLAYEARVSDPVPLLKRMLWHRVILDEAHLLKSVETDQTVAILDLNAQIKWAVTGMPVHSVDLYALMNFLSFFPFYEIGHWMKLIQQPLSQGDDKGLSRLKALLAPISLVRRKENLPSFPPKVVENHMVYLSKQERELYDLVQVHSRDLVQGYVTNRSELCYYSNVLSVILTLRQVCTDLALCRSDWRSLIMSENIGDVANNPQLLEKMIKLLQEGEDFGCPICISPPSDALITTCGHIYCRSCILHYMAISAQKPPLCPMCRKVLGDSSLFEYGGGSRKVMESTKRFVLQQLLEEARDKDPAAKSVVFSQFSLMLFVVEEQLTAAGFNVVMLDWTMSEKKRRALIKQFNGSGPDAPTVLMASLKASAVNGLNLTAASTVYLMEPWWDPLAEDQAVDRVHRVGQKGIVKVVRLIAKNSIEERILAMQFRNRVLCKEHFGIKGAKEKREVNVNDVRMLMSM